MTRRTTLLGLACLSLVVSGCGGGDDPPDLPACTPTPSIAEPGDLPPGFPTPEGVVYTSAEEAGPSTILEGHWPGATLEQAFEGYKAAFGDAGYQVPDEEREAQDAEVNFAGGGTSGQVRLNVRCADRLEVGVTIRPAS